jgi:flagellar biosynthesis/type III secretory pathway protein FliH
MPEEFVPLERFLRPTPPQSQPEAAPAEPEEPEPPAAEHIEQESLRAARRFRAALADALDAAVEELLRRIAHAVLARELELDAPCIAGIVASALDQYGAQNVVAIHANPADVQALSNVGLERIADDSLRRGDVRIELHSGTIDCTLNARLEAAVAASVA